MKTRKIDTSIFTYTYKPNILKKLKIDSPVLLGGSLTEDLKANFFLDNFKKYKSAGFKPNIMLDSVSNLGNSHCGEKLRLTKDNLRNVKKWCKKLAKLTKHITLDIEPVLPEHVPLYKEIRKHYPHNIHGCYGREIYEDVINNVDDSVYMFYDYSTDLRSYKTETKKKLKEILKLNKPFRIGVPIVSSYYEWEQLKNRWGKQILKSPHKMKEYTEACIKILKSVKETNLFKGIIWWGLYDKPMNRHYLKYHPYKIKYNPNTILKKYNFKI